MLQGPNLNLSTVMVLDNEQVDVTVNEVTEAFSAEGKLAKQNEEDKLMNSLLQNDKETIEEGRLINEALNQGIGSFTPDVMMEKMVQNFSMAKQLYGPTLLRLLAGYDASYIQRNIKIPEFQKDLKQRIEEKVDSLIDDDKLDSDYSISDQGLHLASLILYTEELDHLIPKGFVGEKFHKKHAHYGDKRDVKAFAKGDRYRDIAIKKSLTLALKRGHKALSLKDLKTFERHRKGQIFMVYALDASASMRGSKIEQCKKAGIALAFKAIEEKDNVGLLVFGDKIRTSIAPTQNFMELLHAIAAVKPKRQTDLAATLKEAVLLFPITHASKHLMLLTDALPTAGEKPEKETLEAAGVCAAHGITISLVGIGLDKPGKKLAEQIVAIGKGKLYMVKDVKDLDVLVLEDYYHVA